jgi:hypothetical protein
MGGGSLLDSGSTAALGLHEDGVPGEYCVGGWQCEGWGCMLSAGHLAFGGGVLFGWTYGSAWTT